MNRYRSHIGSMHSIAIDSKSPSRAIVFSTSSVVAAVNLKRRTIAWRQVLDQDELPQDVIVNGTGKCSRYHQMFEQHMRN